MVCVFINEIVNVSNLNEVLFICLFTMPLVIRHNEICK